MSELQQLEEIQQSERLFARPSWADPTFNLLTSEWTTERFSLIAGTVARVVPPDPKRWGIIFVRISGGVNNIRLSPDPNPSVYGFDLTTTVLDRRFTIFEYGPLVQSEWYAISANNSEVGYYSLTTQMR